MAPKNIPEHAFSQDDGSADPALAEALAAWHADPAHEPAVLAALPHARLLVPVVAVLTEAETGEDGLRRDKTSEMAVPTLNASGERRALPAFTSTEALARWRADARPVAVGFAQALQALAHEGAGALVLDVAGPVAYELSGPALYAAAGGRTDVRPAADPAVTGALRAVLAAEPEVLGAHLAPGGTGRPDGTGSDGTRSDGTRPDGAASDGTLALVLTPDCDVSAVARRVAERLAAAEALRARLVHGLDVAVLPPGSALPEDALYQR
ncbi:SseB family protein [Streptomyces boncukensis]|uniref:SseB family protein n=1 Tax=Streptomyces boncukensis TaxID=2711219 RepID=A0A6G4WZN5_9ACTN|nr:SseB family protein [Streptomyces boncukensis]